jgi:hypothetical protein
MNKIRKTAIMASMLVSIGLGIVGCEWESPDDDETWSDSYNWVNFSGVYKNPGGGSVVSDFTTASAPVTNTAGSTAVSVGPVTVANGNGGNAYSGQLLPNVVPGSVQIDAGGVVFTDNGTGQLISSVEPGTIEGAISYDSGAWSIDLGGLTVDSGVAIRARYSVYQTSGTTVVAPGSNSSTTHGTSGTEILSFTVMQEGNLLTFIDSDGMSYKGKMGSMRSASGDLGQNPREGDVVIAQYSVTGTSRSGWTVEIVGVFQGTVIVTGSSTSFVMSGRNLQGQWIEKNPGGKVGDVVGVAIDAAIN